MKLLSVTKSTRKDKKWMAEFDTGKIIHFGARGMDDYTIKNDIEQDMHRVKLLNRIQPIVYLTDYFGAKALLYNKI